MMYPERDEEDRQIFEKRRLAYNARPGIRVGDWLRRPSGQMTRVTHIWRWDDVTNSVQDGGQGWGSFYLGDGYCSYSGGLDPGVSPEKIFPTYEMEPGGIWFFHHNHQTAHNRVEFSMFFRVFEIRLNESGNPNMCPHCHNINRIANECGHDPNNLPTRVEKTPEDIKKERLAKCRRWGDVTDNGVCFDWGLAGPDGAWFTLLREPHHSKDDVEIAKKQLHRDRDVVSLSVEGI